MPAPKQSLSADLKDYDKALERLADLYPETAGKTLRRQVVLLAIDIMERTPPGIGKGLTKDAQREGQSAVGRDIDAVYPNARSLSAYQIANYGNLAIFQNWAAAVNGKIPPRLLEMSQAITGKPDAIQKMINGRSAYDFEQFQKLLIKGTSSSPSAFSLQGNFDKSFHIQAKGQNGRVPQDFTSKNFFVKTSGLAAYKRQVQARVGKLKAGWYMAIKSLAEGRNHRKVPAWVKAAADESTGYSEDNSSASRMIASVAIANRIADKNGVTTRVSAIQHAVNFRARMMGREYDEALKDLARKSGNK
jgi:hypothetical protein